MELRSGCRLGSLPTPRPRRGRRPPALSDRISDLPDEMLLQILARLRCARAAAKTSGLSRRWRGLWRHLPKLFFRNISPDALDAALVQVLCPALSFLEVEIREEHRVMDPARVTALAPADLVFSLWGHCKDWNIPIEIPSFERTTSVKLTVWNLQLTAPAAGAGFPLLERLSFAGAYIDTAELVLRCPRLHVLEVSCSGYGWGLSKIDIMAPVLKRFSLSDSMTQDFFVSSFSAPMVENLRWYVHCFIPNAGFGEKWRLRDMSLQMEENVCTLRMSISTYFRDGLVPDANYTFSQQIAQLPAFSVLLLELVTEKHVYGALVPHLLGICSTLRSLEVYIAPKMGKETCSANCSCDQPQNWRNETISLTSLEEVQLRGFGGTDHEVDFLKLLFRCAPFMKTMTVVLDPEFSQTSGACERILRIFWENPGVKFTVYRIRCKN